MGHASRRAAQAEGAGRDERVLWLQTHPGIWRLTSPALVHILEPVSRFGGGRKVAGLRQVGAGGALLGQELPLPTNMKSIFAGF